MQAITIRGIGKAIQHARHEHGLLPGFVKVDQGGVVRIAQLQSEGYVYLRP